MERRESRRPQGRGPRRLRGRAGLVAGACLLGVAVVVAAQWRETPAAAGTTAVARPTAAARPASLPAASPAEPVHWQGEELVVDIDQMPLPQAVSLLAAASHTAVTGIEILRAPVTVSLHGRFGDIAAAWQRLLQGRAGFSLGCAAANCHLWIGSETVAPVAPAAPAAAGTAAPVGGDGAPPEKSLEEQQSQPDGQC